MRYVCTSIVATLALLGTSFAQSEVIAWSHDRPVMAMSTGPVPSRPALHCWTRPAWSGCKSSDPRDRV
jgi:hypothetical protein